MITNISQNRHYVFRLKNNGSYKLVPFIESKNVQESFLDELVSFYVVNQSHSYI